MMETVILPGVRKRQILQVLHEHGPLSLRGVQRLISPPIAIRDLQKVAKRLFDKELVIHRFHNLPRNFGNYFQLCQSLEARIKVGAILNINPELLLQPHVRTPELIHSELCGVWSNYLKSSIPHARIVRDFRFKEDRKVMNALNADKLNLEFMPDLILEVPKKDGKGFIYIAVEIERVRKTRERLYWKIKKLTQQSRLDGVIYVCDRMSMAETLRVIYSNRVIQKAHRVNHYGDNFFLFSTSSISASNGTPTFINAGLQPVILNTWINILRVTQTSNRKDQNFK